MAGLSEIVKQRLIAAAGKGGASADAAELAPYLVELRGRWKGTSTLLLRPDSTETVSRLLAICHETSTPVVPHGGNTGLVGGQSALEGEVILSLERMNRIRETSTADNHIVVEAGAILANVQKAADQAGRLFPLSLAAEGSCTIGGNLSTNAGGTGVLRYGMMRDLVLGLEVVRADGTVLPMLRSLRKDNTGYDLKDVFIGAEGTLGVITAAALKLFPKPAGYATAFAALADSAHAVPLLNHLQHVTGGQVTAFEILSRTALGLVLKHIPGTSDPLPDHQGWFLLIEISNPAAFDAGAALEETLGTFIENGHVLDAVLAKNERERSNLWRIRESISEAQRLEGASLKHDVSVPLSRIDDFLKDGAAKVAAAAPDARLVAFGHIGDGNMHFNVSAAPGRDADLVALRHTIETIVHDAVHARGGSISAEHGLGIAKNEEIARYKSAAEIETMRALKRALDPKNILNPGKVLPRG